MAYYNVSFEVYGNKHTIDGIGVQPNVTCKLSDEEVLSRMANDPDTITTDYLNVAKQIINKYPAAESIYVANRPSLIDALAIPLFLLFLLIAPIMIALGMHGKFIFKGLYKNVIKNKRFVKFRKPYIYCGLVFMTICLILIFVVGFITKNDSLTGTMVPILGVGNIAYFIIGIAVGNKIYKEQVANPDIDYSINENESVSVIKNEAKLQSANSISENQNHPVSAGESGSGKHLQTKPQPVTPTQAIESKENTMQKRVFIFLEDKMFDKADEYCEKILDEDPENAMAYLGKVMAIFQVDNLEQLPQAYRKCKDAYSNNPYFKRFMKYASEDELKLIVEFGKCPQCQAKIDADMAYCGQCGAKLTW